MQSFLLQLTHLLLPILMGIFILINVYSFIQHSYKENNIFFYKETNITGRESWVVVLVSEDCHNKVQKTGWLKTIFFFTVLESRSLKSNCCQGQVISKMSRGNSLFASSCLWQLQVFLGVSSINPISIAVCTWLSSLLWCLWPSFFSSYKHQ